MPLHLATSSKFMESHDVILFASIFCVVTLICCLLLILVHLDEIQTVEVTYASTGSLGCLMYAMVCTRPNLTHAISVINKFMFNLESIEKLSSGL